MSPAAVKAAGDAVEQLQILGHLREGPGLLHLHDDLPAIGEGGRVHLGHGRRRERVGVHVGKDLTDRTSQVALEHGPDALPRLRLSAVGEVRQFPNVGLRSRWRCPPAPRSVRASPWPSFRHARVQPSREP